MSEVRIETASSDRFEDAEHALTRDGGSCWCQWWMLRGKDFDATTTPERRELLSGDLAAPVASALIAYVDDEAAGWVKVSARPDQPRLAHTRSLRHSPEPFDDASVWAITCFVVRREFRRHGLAGRLLDAAIAHARAHGGRVVEGYPLDLEAKHATSNELFHGALSMFLDAGFTEVARPASARPIVSLALA